MLSNTKPPNHWYLALAFDQFAAQVIYAWHPELRDTPFVVVRQETDSHKSCVWAASIKAKALGIEPGMPVMALERRHPTLVAVPRDPELEKTALSEISLIIDAHTPDFTLAEQGRALILTQGPCPAAVAKALCGKIKFRLGLVEIAAGAAQSGFVAKLMLHYARPDGIRLCGPGAERASLAPLPVGLLPGLSSQCRERLADYALHTVGQVQGLSRDFLVSRLGPEGEALYAMAQGMDNERQRSRLPQSLKAETVLTRDVNDEEQIRGYVKYTADQLSHILKSQSLRIDAVTCMIRYSDNRRVQRSMAFADVVDDYPAIAEAAQKLFAELYTRRVAIRGITLSAARPQSDTGQLNLFETFGERKQKAVAAGIGRIRNKMGFKTILSASCLEVAR